MPTFNDVVLSALHPFGLKVAHLKSERDEHNKIIAASRLVQATHIVDVGASTGRLAATLFKSGWDGGIISFEPLPQAHATLCERAKGNRAWVVAQRCALGDRSHEASMEIAGNSASSSLLHMREEHIAAAPQSAPIGKVIVPVRRLDDCAEVPRNTRLFLKIDTQGYELNVLRGATGILPDTQGILLETSLTALYEGQPLMREVINHLDSLGFDPYDMIPGIYHPKTGRMLQINVIAIRRGSPVMLDLSRN